MMTFKPVANSALAESISVVMPSYNDGHFLESAIKTYMDQTCTPDEIIVVVDGSTDDSMAILERLKGRHSCLRVVYLKEHVGVNEAVNIGVAGARGKYLRLSSTHDPIHKEFLETMLSIMSQHPQAAIGFCDPGYITETGNKILFQLRLSNTETYIPVGLFQKMLQKVEFTIPSASTLFLLDNFKRNGGFQNSFGHHADWYANFSCAFDFGVCYVPQNLAFYKLHNKGHLASRKTHFGAEACILRKILGRLMEDEYGLKWQRFRNSGILPVMNIRMCLFLLCETIGRKFLTAHCVRHCIANSIWSVLRPYTPIKIRDLARVILTPRADREI